MKGIIDISCASQAATSIRRFTTMDEGSSSSSSSSITTVRLGGSGNSSGRAIDRYNPIIRDSSRIGKLDRNTTPDQPITPKPTHESGHKNSRKKKIFSSSKENNPNPNHHQKKISSSNISSSSSSSSAGATKKVINDHEKPKSITKRSSWSCTNPGEFFSPPGSSRYLLTSTEHQKSVNLPDFDPLLQPPPPLLLPSKPKPHLQSSSAAVLPPTSSRQVVVVLRVSLHCRGCERKMRKHLSRMEGVTSFDIDFIAKKLTVVGDVTPLAVLASVSKVKNAQLLTLPPSSSTPSASAPSQITKDLAIIV